MESKYKTRAEEILINHYGCRDLEDLQKCFLNNLESSAMIFEAMYQLAEEVEKETKIDFFCKGMHQGHENLKHDYYSKEQVETLLEEQRKLCADASRVEFIVDKKASEYRQQSILNAKLRIK